VETAVYFAILSALVLMIFLILLASLNRFLNSLGVAGAVSGFVITFMGLHALCSVFWGLWFRFSRRQFRLLAKVILTINGGVSALSIGYSYLIFAVMDPLIRNPNSPAIWVVGSMNLLLIGAVFLLKKTLGKRVGQWFRIRYIPEGASLEVAEKHSTTAKDRLGKGHLEGASQEFHAAAVMFLRLEDWSKTAQNYWMAAETLSREPNPEFDFDVAWLYALSSSAYLLSDDTEKAGKALELGKEALKDGKIAKKAEEKISLIIDFLVAIITKNTQQANEIWPNINRRLRRWGYTVIEETELLLEKVYNTVN
jgi:hypothetical protein